MLVQYYLANGTEIKYQTSMDIPTMEDINVLALMVAEANPKSLPDCVFVNVRVYGQMMSQWYSSNIIRDDVFGMNLMVVHSSVGVLKVVPTPMASDAKLLLVGRREDFDRYDIDKIFEEIVLKDCTRED